MTERHESIVQIFKPAGRDPRCAEIHARAGRRVEHPGLRANDNAGIALEQDEVAIGAPECPVIRHRRAMIGMPTVVNRHRSPDMGRMNRN